jgi:hypothetical protein
MRVWKSLVFAAALIAVPLQAQPAPSEPDSGTIEVRGKREIDKAIVSNSIMALTRRIKVMDVVPRFYQPLCLQVTGPDMATSRIIAERIITASELTGLDKPEPDCRVNALVILVDDPERLFDKLVARHRPIVGGLDRDVHARRLRDDLAAGKPAIFWNRNKIVAGVGPDYIENGVPVRNQVNATRIMGSVYRSKILSVVVFDTNRLAGATPVQLGDYAAMHLLANPNRDIDFEVATARSILTLFADTPDLAAEGLTAFDRAYLEGIYATGRNGWRGKVNRAVLAAYEAECADEKPDCQFLVASDDK